MSQSYNTKYGANTWSIRTEISRPLVMGMFGMVAAGHYLAALRWGCACSRTAAMRSMPASPPG